jgi:hypothetical protein
MTMTEWFLAELESEAAKSRRVLEQVPSGKRDWKPHERSMELGYLSDLVATFHRGSAWPSRWTSWISRRRTRERAERARPKGRACVAAAVRRPHYEVRNR